MRRSNDGSVSLQIAFADFMAEPVVPGKNPKHPPKAGIGLAAHAGRQHALCKVRIVLEQRGDDSRAQCRPKRLVEIVLQCERALPRGGFTRVKRGLGIVLLERSDDARGIRDGPPIEPQNRQFALTGRAPDLDQVVGAEHTAPVRDALIIKRPAHLFAVVRERDVPQRRCVHGDFTLTQSLRRQRQAGRPADSIRRLLRS